MLLLMIRLAQAVLLLLLELLRLDRDARCFHIRELLPSTEAAIIVRHVVFLTSVLILHH